MRAIRTHEYLYIRNFAPDRWPTGGPTFISSNKAPHGDIDDGPFKDFMLDTKTQRSFPFEFDLGFGKRPFEELYHVNSDPHQIRNLANNPEYEETKQELWQRLQNYLRQTSDPRIEGQDPWQAYTYRQIDGFGASFNFSLSETERASARGRSKHQVSPGARE